MSEIAGPMTLAVTVDAVVPLEVFTIRYALAVLGAHNGNKTRAARALCIDRRCLYRMLDRAAELGMVS